LTVLRLLVATLGLGIALLVAIILVPFTESGTRLLIATLDGVGGLELEHASGKLLGELTLRRLRLPTDDVIVTVADLRARLNTDCLWRGDICLQMLFAGDVDVEVLDRVQDESTDEAEADPYWPLPLGISSPDVSVSALRIHWKGGEIRAEQISAAVDLVDDRILVSTGVVSNTRLNMPERADKTSSESLDLPDIDLPLELVLQGVMLRNSSWDIYGLRHDYDELEVTGRWAGDRLTVSEGHIRNRQWGSLALQGEMKFEHPYALRFDGGFESATPPLWKGLHDARGDLLLRGNLASLQLEGQICGVLPVTVRAEIDLVTPGWPLALAASGGCDEAQPTIMLSELPGFAMFPAFSVAPAWSLAVDGDLDRQSVALQASLIEQDYGPVNLDVSGVNRAGVLHLDRAMVSRRDGVQSLQLAGDLEYGEQLVWNLQLELNSLELPRQLQPLSGQLSGALQTSGVVDGDAWKLELSQAAVHGSVNELPASISGVLRIDQNLDLDGSDLNVILNGVDLRIVDRAGVLPRVDLVVDDFSRWVEGASGGLTAALLWDRDNALITLDAESQDLRLGTARLEDLVLSGRHDYTQAGEFLLTVQGNRAQLVGVGQQTVVLNLHGTPRRHSLRVALEGELDTELVLDGSWQEGRWSGLLQPMALTMDTLDLHLEQAVAVDFLESERQLSLAGHCWTDPRAQLCIKQLDLGASGAVDADLTGDLNMLAQLLPERYRLRGPLTARVRAGWQELELKNLVAELQIKPGEIQEEIFTGDPAQFAWEDFSLQYRGDSQNGRLQGSLRRDGSQNFSLDLNMPAALDGRLSGALVLNDFKLGAFQPFLEQFSVLSGELAGSLQLAGRVREPEIRGELSLSNGTAALAGTPNQLENISLRALFKGQRAELVGELFVGGGSSQLRGELDWLETPSLSLAMSGSEKTLAFPVDTIVAVSEELLLEITSERARLSGTVDIPRGELVVDALPGGAAEVSDDVVLFSRNVQQAEAGGQVPVEIDVQVRIADQFQVIAEGLSGRLGGDVRVHRSQGKPLRVLGLLTVHEGAFELLGPRFDVKRGKLSFVGVPDNPALDIVLERQITEESVTVGIRVGGSLALPELDFYSRPALPQEEVMAYVLGGRGIDRTGDSDSLALALAMASGLMQSKGLLKGVSLGVEGRDRKARAAIGGYISESIYLSYGIGLYTPVNTLTVRMDIIRNLWVEMVSGLESSADIYYAWSSH
jgi:translocation and assembly module TamB